MLGRVKIRKLIVATSIIFITLLAVVLSTAYAKHSPLELPMIQQKGLSDELFLQFTGQTNCQEYPNCTLRECVNDLGELVFCNKRSLTQVICQTCFPD